MQSTLFERVGQEMYTALPGIPVFILPKKDFRKTYAFLAVNYGSVDLHYAVDGRFRDTPAGVAHFLEHKMFDMPNNINAMQLFAQTGALPNAFTSHSMTAYHFQTADHFLDNLKILMNLVFIPYFTKESVDKEQGIIAQEISMMADNPRSRVYDNLFASLYEGHPVRIPIAGTHNSIREITAPVLYDCYEAFYHMGNVCLCVAGDVDPDEVCRQVETMKPNRNSHILFKDYGLENHNLAHQRKIECPMAVGTPLFALGFKVPPPPKGRERIKFDMLADLAMEALCGPASPLYDKLYKSGLINRNFDYGAFAFSGGAALLALGESRDPAAVSDHILREANKVKKEGFSSDLFDRLKKAALGARMRQLDSPEALCRLQASAYFYGANYLDFAEIFDTLTAEEAADFIRLHIDDAKRALSIVQPMP